MALVILTKPAAAVLSAAEFRAHARLDDAGDAATIEMMIAAVTSWLAGPQGWLGRSLILQTLALTVPLGIRPGFTGPVIDCAITGVALPRPPVVEVQSVSVVDGSGNATAIPADGFTTHDADDGLTHVLFTSSFRMPVVASGSALLRIVYRAGYGPAGGDVDPGIRHAMLMAVMRLYAGRGDPTVSLGTDPFMAELFAPFRVWSRG